MQIRFHDPNPASRHTDTVIGEAAEAELSGRIHAGEMSCHGAVERQLRFGIVGADWQEAAAPP
jgi:hypothetical protein